MRDREISQECVTANEMREGPSKSACRRRLQTLPIRFAPNDTTYGGYGFVGVAG